MASTVDSTPQKIRACTVSRDVQNFDLLIEDMEAVFQEDWGDLNFSEATAFLQDTDSADLEIRSLRDLCGWLVGGGLNLLPDIVVTT